jgi:hypothetical protein
MRQLRPLIFIAVTANSLTLILYSYAASQPGGTGIFMYFILFWMPAVWLTSIIATVVIAIIKRKKLFHGQIFKWTLLTMLFATPLPILALMYLISSKDYREGTSVNHKDGKVYITETWANRSNYIRTLEKHFTADSIQERTYGEKSYKKDSSWIYFESNGDTIKIEYYKNDNLISTKQFKTK